MNQPVIGAPRAAQDLTVNFRTDAASGPSSKAGLP